MSNEPSKKDPHTATPEEATDGDAFADAETGDVIEDATLDTGAIADPQAARIAELESQIAELKDHSLRVLADSENLRKRTEREREQWQRYAAAGLAKDLLNALDNLRRALDAVPEDRDSLDASIKNVIVGVEMTEKELLAAFEKHAIVKIDPLGQKFDPNFHQAMFEVEDPEQPQGTVVQVLAAGYLLHDRLLRAAMVGVSKGGPAASHAPVDTTA